MIAYVVSKATSCYLCSLQFCCHSPILTVYQYRYWWNMVFKLRATNHCWPLHDYFGYCSVRFIQKLCETDIRFLWLLDEENAPSHMTINNFIHNELSGRLEDIFNDINRYMFGQLGVDLDHRILAS